MAAQPDWDQLLQQSEDLAARVRSPVRDAFVSVLCSRSTGIPEVHSYALLNAGTHWLQQGSAVRAMNNAPHTGSVQAFACCGMCCACCHAC